MQSGNQISGDSPSQKIIMQCIFFWFKIKGQRHFPPILLLIPTKNFSSSNGYIWFPPNPQKFKKKKKKKAKTEEESSDPTQQIYQLNRIFISILPLSKWLFYVRISSVPNTQKDRYIMSFKPTRHAYIKFTLNDSLIYSYAGKSFHFRLLWCVYQIMQCLITFEVLPNKQ